MRLLFLSIALLAACAGDPAPAPAPATPVEPARPATEAPAAPASAAADTSEWAVGVVERPASGDGQAQLMAVRAARHDGHDRLVFEFEAERPSVHVEYVDRPVRACGSGEVVPLPGDAWLQIRFTAARAHTEAGEATVDPARRDLGLPNVLALASTCDFEGEVTYVAAVRSPEGVRVSTLDGPPRVAVDVRHL